MIFPNGELDIPSLYKKMLENKKVLKSANQKLFCIKKY